MNLKKRSLKWFTLLSVILITISCAKLGAPIDPDLRTDKIAPFIETSFPDRGVIDLAVPINAEIVIPFTEEMNSKTICGDYIYLSTEMADPVTGEIKTVKIPCHDPVIDGNTVTLKPMILLAADKEYTVFVSKNVSDLAGNILGTDISWNFTAKDIGRLRVSQGTDILESGEFTKDFSNMFISASTADMEITLANFGNKNLTIKSVALADETDFVLNDKLLNTEIKALESKTFNVKFKPTSEGIKNVVLTISYIDGTTPSEPPDTFSEFTVNLTGNGIPAPDFMVGYLTDPADPATFVGIVPGSGEYDFAEIVLGKSSDVLTMAIKNSRAAGGDNITISDIQCSNENFIMDKSSIASAIAPEGMTTFTIYYKPSTVITDESSILQVSSPDVVGGIYPITLKGTGKNPEIKVECNDSDITINDIYSLVGSHYEGFIGNTISFKISNIGNGDLIITETITIAGTNAGDFNIVYAPASGSVIEEGADVDIILSFTPGDGGERTSILTIKNDDLDESDFVVNISANVNNLDSIDVSAPNYDITINNTVQFTALGNYSDGAVKTITDKVTWISSDESNGTINNTGLFSTKPSPGGRGYTTIRATLIDQYQEKQIGIYEIVTRNIWEENFNGQPSCPDGWTKNNWSFSKRSGSWNGVTDWDNRTMAENNSGSDGNLDSHSFDSSKYWNVKLQFNIRQVYFWFQRDKCQVYFSSNDGTDWTHLREWQDPNAGNGNWETLENNVDSSLLTTTAKVRFRHDNDGDGHGNFIDWVRVYGTTKAYD